MRPDDMLFRAISVLVTRLGGDVEINMSELEKAQPATLQNNPVNNNIRLFVEELKNENI